MKRLLKISFALILCYSINLSPSFAQNKDNEYIPAGRYLVIGTFRIKNNAIGFTQYVKNMHKYEVHMAYHPIKQYYYVYIKGYGPNEKGFNDATDMRKQTEFIDTWFMVVKPYKIPDKQFSATNPKATSNRKTVPTDDLHDISPKVSDEKPNTSDGWVKIGGTPQPKETKEESNTSDGWVKVGGTPEPNEAELDTALAKATPSITETTALESDIKIIPKTYSEYGKYKFFFNTFYIRNYKEVKGPVEIINPKTLKLLRVAQSLELVKIADPHNGEHAVQLIANIFGYKKVQHDIKLNEPFDVVNEEFFHFKGDTLIADFPLRRYDKGEIATMYNVFFFKDAAIMKPSSKFELNSLIDMLKENDRLKIKIHGHTNGNAAGRIISLPEGAEDFFTLNQEIIEKNGSAKTLSLLRAELIKRYLVSFGIDPARMEVYGWGGKKPLYDKMDKLAIKNVRVEIEILDN